MTADELDELFYQKTGWRDVERVECPEEDYPCVLCPYRDECRGDDDEIPF